jgi:hypothetical protein
MEKRFIYSMGDDETDMMDTHHNVVVGRVIQDTGGRRVLVGIEYPRDFHGHSNRWSMDNTNWHSKCWWIDRDELHEIDERLASYFGLHKLA